MEHTLGVMAGAAVLEEEAQPCISNDTRDSANSTAQASAGMAFQSCCRLRWTWACFPILCCYTGFLWVALTVLELAP